MVDLKQAAGRFSASDAAFTGLRLIRRQPATVAVWGAAYLLFTFALGAVMVLMIGPSMAALQAQQRMGAAADPAAGMALMSRFLPFEGLALVASLAFYAVMFAAVNRAVLRPGAGRPGRLALGADEGHQLLLFIILGVLFFVLYVALAIVAVIVGVVVGIAAAGAHASAAAGGTPPGPVFAVALVMILLVLLTLGAVATRLSLASALTFDNARVDVFGSWRATRGVFWPLFGAYVLAWLTALVLYLAALVVFCAVAVAVGGGLSATGVIFRPDMSSLGSYYSPLLLLWLAIVSVAGTVALVIILAAPVGAYAQLKALGRIPPPSTPGLGGAGTAVPPTRGDLPRFGR